MSSSDDGDVVIVDMMVEASVESTMLGMAVTPTAVVVVATMTVFGAVAYVPARLRPCRRSFCSRCSLSPTWWRSGWVRAG
jgi:hypothetical protein